MIKTNKLKFDNFDPIRVREGHATPFKSPINEIWHLVPLPRIPCPPGPYRGNPNHEPRIEFATEGFKLKDPCPHPRISRVFFPVFSIQFN